MSVPITYRQKMDFGSCVQMVGFPKYGHKYLSRLQGNPDLASAGLISAALSNSYNTLMRFVSDL